MADDYYQLTNEEYKAWDLAIELEKKAKEMKENAHNLIIKKYPKITGKNWHQIKTALKYGKLQEKAATEVAALDEKISAATQLAKEARQRHNELFQKRTSADTRRLLDPSRDPIPPGNFKKFKNCSQFPLRQSCDCGGTSTEKWERCKFMDKEKTTNYSYPVRWFCSAPSDSAENN